MKPCTRSHVFRAVIAVTVIVTSGVCVRAQAIVTVAGGGPKNVPALSSSLARPFGLAASPKGDVFILDSGGARDAVVRMDATGVLFRVAGYAAIDCSAPASLGDGGPAGRSCLDAPGAVALDAAGNLYVADQLHNRIRRVDALSGIITTVAGSGTPGYGGDGGPATHPSVRISQPTGVAVDGAGHVYIADRGNHRIRRVDAFTGFITTFAGTGIRTGSIDGPGGDISDDLNDGAAAGSCTLSGPRGVWLDPSGNLLVSDSGNFRVRRVSAATGVITTRAGDGAAGYAGENVPAASASLAGPWQVVTDGSGNLFIADFDPAVSSDHRVRRVDAVTGTIATVAGGAPGGFSGDGGPATAARLSSPSGVAVDSAGNLLIADQLNSRVRRVNPATGIITTVAGGGDASGYPATSASLQNPQGVWLAAGSLYIADAGGHRVRRMNLASGVMITMAGNGVAQSSGDGGQAVNASLNLPSSVVVDSIGDLYIAERLGNRVRRVDAATGLISTFAGNGTGACGAEDIAATASSLLNPAGVALDTAGNLLIADAGCNRVRRVNAPTHIISTIAGNGTSSFSGDGGAATAATMRNPGGIVLDASSNLFIADTGNSRVREVIAASGIISTVAGGGGGGDGSLATNALLRSPNGVAVDSSGNLFIAELNNHKIRRVDAGTAIISTAGGSATAGYAGDGGPVTLSRLYRPYSVAVSPSGDLFIADGGNNRIRSVIIDPPASGTAPDPLTITRKPTGELTLSWSESCAANDTDYEIYEGVLGDYGSHFPLFCSTGGGTALTFSPSLGNTYYLVVPRNAYHEGSYGQTSSGVERLPGSGGSCMFRRVGSCN